MTDTNRSGGAATRGSSGATLEVDAIYEGSMWKSGPHGETRVYDQGEYIRSFDDTPILPLVHGTRKMLNCYRMERLYDPPPLEFFDASRLVVSFHTDLENAIWCHKPLVEFDRKEHIKKLMTIVPSEDWDDVYHSCDMLTWNTLKACRTHGDPTFDNLMFRGQVPVIIDPIPPTPAVPDLMAVDLGKMMQSLMGFEQIRYGITPAANLWDGIDTLFRLVNDEDEIEAAWYWCAIHLYRAAPYMPEEVKPRVLELARTALDRPTGL